MGRAASARDEPAVAQQTAADIRDAPMYRLSMLASLGDRRAQAQFSAKFDVSLGEWRALANIRILEPVTLAELSRTMLLDKGQLSRTVQRLVQRRWVVSRPMPGNRGALLLTITAAGREIYAALFQFALERNEASMSVLTPEERACFMTCIDKLRARMERQHATETARQAQSRRQPNADAARTRRAAKQETSRSATAPDRKALA